MESVVIPKTSKQAVKYESSWKFFLRQAFIASSVWTIVFCNGLFMGSPTVIIPQLRRAANSTDAVTEEMASWLSSAFCYSALPWVFILPNMARIFGRKKTFLAVSLSNVISFSVFYFSSTPTHLLITEVLIGMTYASIFSVNVIVISEFTSPIYRGVFLTMKSAAFSWGVLISNTIGAYTRWNYIPLVGLLCSLYTLTAIFWPESPHWLASKKRFDETRKVYRRLNGTGVNSDLELEAIIKSHSNDGERPRNFNYVTRKEFYKPLVLSVLTIIQFHSAGKFAMTVYAVDILNKIMGNERDSYKSMLILDGFTVLSTYIGCVLTKLYNRRTILFTASAIAILFLFLTAVYLYLIKLSMVEANVYWSLLLLIGFTSSVCCGPIVLSTTIYTELIPVSYQSVFVIVTTIVYFVVHGSLLKISPRIFHAFTMPGTFLFFSISLLVSTVLMYVYVPETKDKTLLDIEGYFKSDKSGDESQKLMKPLPLLNAQK